MSRGPLRRFVGAAGLAGLAPTSYMLVSGSVTPVDAALRAVATLALVMGLGRVANQSLQHLLAAYERSHTDDGSGVAATTAPADTPRRRSDDT